MVSAKQYIHEDEHGALRVGESDVSLDSVVFGFTQGDTAETIQQHYPAMSLEEVYGAIAYYLANREAVERYLEKQDARWSKERELVERDPSAVMQRLRALRQAAARTTP